MSDGKRYVYERFDDDIGYEYGFQYKKRAESKLIDFLNENNIPKDDIVSIQTFHDIGTVIILVYRK